MTESKDESKDVQTEDDLSDADKEVLADMRTKFGKRIAFWYDEDFGLVVAVRPRGALGEANYNRLVNELQDPDVDKAVALRQFALACTAYPAREQARKIFEDYPAFALKVAGRAQRLAGSQVKELGKA